MNRDTKYFASFFVFLAIIVFLMIASTKLAIQIGMLAVITINAVLLATLLMAYYILIKKRVAQENKAQEQ